MVKSAANMWRLAKEDTCLAAKKDRQSAAGVWFPASVYPAGTAERSYICTPLPDSSSIKHNMAQDTLWHPWMVDRLLILHAAAEPTAVAPATTACTAAIHPIAAYHAWPHLCRHHRLIHVEGLRLRWRLSCCAALAAAAASSTPPR
jgi:hypothetical protein